MTSTAASRNGRARAHPLAWETLRGLALLAVATLLILVLLPAMLGAQAAVAF